MTTAISGTARSMIEAFAINSQKGKKMTDYIKREDALKEMMTQEEAMNMSNEQAVQILIPMRNMMCDQNGCPISDAVFALDKAIESLSADVAPVRHGCWQITDAYPHNVYCSECHTKCAQTHWAVWEDGSLPRRYCPNCGARMDERKDDEID